MEYFYVKQWNRFLNHFNYMNADISGKCLHALKNLLKSQKIIQIIIKIIIFIFQSDLRQNLSEVV